MLTKNSITKTDLDLFHSLTKFNFDLSIIVPTRNEAGNVHALLEHLNQVLTGTRAEVLFVDNSTDETPASGGSRYSTIPCPDHPPVSPVAG